MLTSRLGYNVDTTKVMGNRTEVLILTYFILSPLYKLGSLAVFCAH